MLVGEHGRVIPFRHFKALIIGVGVVLILSLCALILLGVLYTRQRGQIGHLQVQLEQLRTQSTKIRDEKDLYLTQLIALQKQTGMLPQKSADAAVAIAEGGPPPADANASQASEKAAHEAEEAAPQVEEAKKEIPVQKVEPEVRWSADIRRFEVSYDNRQGVLTAELRIYNTSRPKKRLRGRTVLIFKAIGDPPSQWAIEPTVPLHNEIPVGKGGRFFSIRNYQTERFKTLRRKNSPKYDMAAVYIFEDQGGELIGKKELPFNVDYSPPAPPKPVVTPPKTEPEETTAPPRVPQKESASPGQSTPGESIAPEPAPGKTETPSSITPPDSPSLPSSPETLPEQEQPKPQIDLDTDDNGTLEPGASDTIAPTPPAEPKPAQEGEVK